jgi:hypothetical protein
MRHWTRQLKFEDANRARGLCTRSAAHGRIDPRSKNLCADCLRRARELGRESREPLRRAA